MKTLFGQNVEVLYVKADGTDFYNYSLNVT